MHFFKKNPLLVLIVVSMLLICGIFSKIIFHPNQYLLASGGDAFKNLFTPAWFIANDNGTHFTGMNYPYGEHVVFTDNQPLISWILNFVDNNIYPIQNYTIGILNILLFVSLFFGILLLYKILKYYRMPAWYAAIMALAIGLMGPQIERFYGHFALGYTVFIPWIWWRIIQVKEKNYRLLPLLSLLTLVIIFGLIHMYYVLIGGLLIGFHALVLFVKNRKNYISVFKLIAAAGIPLLAIMTFMHFTDTVTDRPETPYGFFRYKANFQTVFLPDGGSLANWGKKFLNMGQANPEGYAYVGYMGLIFLFILLFIFIKRLAYKKSLKKSFLLLPGDLGAFVFTGVLMLLFSMTFPFNLGLEFLLDIITPLKQFRSPGRFAWGFYYFYLVFIAVLIYLLQKKIHKRHPKAAKLFFVSTTIVLCAESLSYFSHTGIELQRYNASNPFDGKNIYFSDMLTNTPYQADDFDAILFLPSMFQGSEKLYIDRTQGDYFMKALELAYQTKLPVVNYMMSRTSLSETMNNVQLVAHPYINNSSSTGVFSLNKLLIMTCDLPKNAGEQYLLDHATKFAEKSGFELYAFDMSAAHAKGDNIAIADYHAVKDSLHQFVSTTGTSYWSEKPLQIFFRNSFENNPTESAFLGKGAFCNNKAETELANIPVSTAEPIWIEASCWITNSIKDVAYPYLTLYFLGQNGELIAEHSITPTLSTDVMSGWVRASENFEVVPAVKQIRVVTSDNSKAWYDELLIRHTAFNAYYDVVSDKIFMVNNFSIGK